MWINQREQLLNWNLEGFGQEKQMGIAYLYPPRFDFCQCPARYVPTGHLQFDRRIMLSPSPQHSQSSDLWADEIQISHDRIGLNQAIVLMTQHGIGQMPTVMPLGGTVSLTA
ncbi:hypothetical protein GCM10023213_32480 [Prosthecobacter algae]|uniref:Uncharacterized protein n=1 Tax=Prosthecobacter algae TaxID=1144682 RepID=A0ABP9PEF1_9BACT